MVSGAGLEPTLAQSKCADLPLVDPESNCHEHWEDSKIITVSTGVLCKNSLHEDLTCIINKHFTSSLNARFFIRSRELTRWGQWTNVKQDVCHMSLSYNFHSWESCNFSLHSLAGNNPKGKKRLLQIHNLVHLTWLEQARNFFHKHLKLACLPIPPQVHVFSFSNSRTDKSFTNAIWKA